MATATAKKTAKPATPAPIDDQAIAQAVATFSLLSDATRLRVVIMLGDGELFVGQMCERIGISQPALSHHVALLKHSGVIYSRRAGKFNYYSLSAKGREAIKAARALVG